MSKGELDLILTAVESIKQELTTKIELTTKGIMIKTDADMNIVSGAIHNHNGRIKELEGCSELSKEARRDYKQFKGQVVAVKKKWLWWVLALVVLIVIVATIVDIFGTTKIFEFLIKGAVSGNL